MNAIETKRLLLEMPQPPSELETLTYLDSRTSLTSNERLHFESLLKGFEGELKFYHLLKNYLTANSINFFDLQLECNNNEFQIDCLLLFEDVAYLIELKNFDGDFLVNDNEWYFWPSKKELHNPLQQLQRTQILLKELFRQLGFHLPIKPFLVFINPQFTLYQAPYEPKIVFPGQVMRFIQMLNRTPSKLSRMHTQLEEALVERHIVHSQKTKIPKYDYEQLKKGVLCSRCGGALIEATRTNMKCEVCGEVEGKDDAILRNTYEFHVLFPKRKITLNAIYEWCGERVSKKAIRRVLANELVIQRAGRSSYYIFNKDKYSLMRSAIWYKNENSDCEQC